MKVAFLTNIVSPYRLPVFQRLAETPGWRFKVICNAESEFDRAWSVETKGCDVAQTRTWSIRRRVHSEEPVPFDQVITLHVPVGLWSDLRAFAPDVVISHELGPRTALAAAYCRLHRIPLVIWCYQSRVSASQGSGPRQAFRRRLLGQARVVVGMGTQARDVLRAWGVEDERIVDAPNAADHDSLLRRYGSPDSRATAEQLRARYGDGRRIAAVFGRLVPLKGTANLLSQWRELPQPIRDKWRLVFVGDGPLASMVRGTADPGIVHAGHADAAGMADWYRATDLHIFPTLGDVWGLVMNEASACGVPTLCSVHAGCSDDLVRESFDGLLYDPVAEDASARLAQALTRSDHAEIGRRARQVAASFTLDRLADGFRRAVSSAKGGDHREVQAGEATAAAA